MKIDRVSTAQMSGLQRIYVRYLPGTPQIRPEGWPIVFIASGIRVQ
jgi:hypothetical protein